MAELVLYGDASYECPYVFHVAVALGELGVPYKLELLKRPLGAALVEELRRHALLGATPCLVHGDLWLTESSAISEYLAETFAPPRYPRILPTSAAERGRARQLLSWLRTSLAALRADRPTSSLFGRPVSTPLSERGRADADELVRVAEQVLPDDRHQLFTDWTIVDLDLALALMRLIANGDRVPQRLVDYAMAQWGRHAVRKYLAYLPTSH